MNRQALSSIVVLSIISLIVLFWYNDTTQKSQIQDATTWQSSPDFFISQMETQEFDKNGKLRYMLKAQDLTHVPLNQQTKLINPQLTFYNQKYPWHAKAKRGWVLEDGKRLVLEEQVELYRDASDTQPIHMETDYLTIEINTEIAHTEKAVVIKSANGHLETVGMQAKLKDNALLLKSKVKGTHAPISI